MGCTFVKTGLPMGTCGNIKADTDPDLECAAGCCNAAACGTGNCLDGEDCSAGGAGECVNATCNASNKCGP